MAAGMLWINKHFSLCSDELPYLKCPLHTVLKLTPVAYGQSRLLLPLTLTLVALKQALQRKLANTK